MKTILVLTDLSPKAEHVAVQAVKLAEIMGADILLSHSSMIAEEAVSAQANYWPVDSFRSLEDDIKKRLTVLSGTLGKGLTGRPFLPKIQTHYQIGDFANRLRSLSGGQSPFLIIMGMRNDTHVSGSPLESEAWVALTSAGLPILFIPQSWHFKKIEHVTWANDLRQINESNKLFLKTFISLFGAELTMVHVCASPCSRKVELEGQLKHFAHGLPASVNRILEGKDLGSTLRQYITHEHVELLVMVHHYSGLPGSVYRSSRCATGRRSCS